MASQSFHPCIHACIFLTHTQGTTQSLKKNHLYFSETWASWEYKGHADIQTNHCTTLTHTRWSSQLIFPVKLFRLTYLIIMDFIALTVEAQWKWLKVVSYLWQVIMHFKGDVHCYLTWALNESWLTDTRYITNYMILHHLLTNGSSAVNGCRQNESPNSW